MKILAIETSCDETAVALLEVVDKKDHKAVTILGNALLSQTPIHALMGGVVPMLAKREHANNLIPMLTITLQEAGKLKQKISPKSFSKLIDGKLKKILAHEPDLYDAFTAFIPTLNKIKIDMIAVTHGPGLEPALWVGINFAKALSLVWDVPVVPINHMEGHILSAALIPKNETDKKNFILKKPAFPLLALLISGGHTEIVLSKKIGSYHVIGETRDDAIGEAYDKVARMLGLPYPGGPQIDKLAREAIEKNVISKYPLPRPMLHTDDLDFSFSGLKTSVLYTVKKIEDLQEGDVLMLAREFVEASTDVIVGKMKKAIQKTKAKTVAVGGGVIASSHIRTALTQLVKNEFPDIALYIPEKNLTTDNAIMIGLSAAFKPKTGKKNIKAEGNLRLK